MCGTDFYRHMPDLAQKLDEIVPIEGATKTHFANSGAEAAEIRAESGDVTRGVTKVYCVFQFVSRQNVRRNTPDALTSSGERLNAAIYAAGTRCYPRSISE